MKWKIRFEINDEVIIIKKCGDIIPKITKVFLLIERKGTETLISRPTECGV